MLPLAFFRKGIPGSHRARGRRGTHNHPSQSAPRGGRFVGQTSNHLDYRFVRCGHDDRRRPFSRSFAVRVLGRRSSTAMPFIATIATTCGEDERGAEQGPDEFQPLPVPRLIYLRNWRHYSAPTERVEPGRCASIFTMRKRPAPGIVRQACEGRWSEGVQAAS